LTYPLIGDILLKQKTWEIPWGVHMIELAMELWTKYPWNLYANTAHVAIEETPLLAFDVNVVAVEQAVAMLIPREKSVVLMRHQHGLKFREIAEQLPNLKDETKNVNSNRARQLLHKAHRNLRASPLADSFLFSGVTVQLEDEIARKERQLTAANAKIDELKRELEDTNPLFAKLHAIQGICRVTIADCNFNTRIQNAMRHQRNHTVCDVLAKASVFTDSLDPLREYLGGVNNLGEKSIAEVIDKFIALGIYSVWP